jgi:predicted histone-like DNA-binding protein
MSTFYQKYDHTISKVSSHFAKSMSILLAKYAYILDALWAHLLQIISLFYNFLIHKEFVMALKYRLIQRVNPRNPEAPRSFYAKAVTKGDVQLRQLSQEIADMSTVSVVDIIGVIESFIQLIPRHLTQGDIVRLGDFGAFAIGILSEGAEQEKDFTAKMITTVKIYFRPGKELKHALALTEFEKEQ